MSNSKKATTPNKQNASTDINDRIIPFRIKETRKSDPTFISVEDFNIKNLTKGSKETSKAEG